jgi:hypothetical protein
MGVPPTTRGHGKWCVARAWHERGAPSWNPARLVIFEAPIAPENSLKWSMLLKCGARAVFSCLQLQKTCTVKSISQASPLRKALKWPMLLKCGARAVCSCLQGRETCKIYLPIETTQESAKMAHVAQVWCARSV